MKRYFLLGVVASSVAAFVACSSGGDDVADSGNQDASQKDSTTQDSAATDSATKDSGTTDSSTQDSATDSATDSSVDASGKLTLTIRDYLDWCNVTVNNGSPNTGDPQTYALDPDASVVLHGDTANANAFYWGYWGNVNDAGVLADGGMDINKDVTFNINSNLTLHACCPDNGQPLTQCTF